MKVSAAHSFFILNSTYWNMSFPKKKAENMKINQVLVNANGKMLLNIPTPLFLPPKAEEARIEKVPAAKISHRVENDPKSIARRKKRRPRFVLLTKRNRIALIIWKLYSQ